jgi:hypothetical protein
VWKDKICRFPTETSVVGSDQRTFAPDKFTVRPQQVPTTGYGVSTKSGAESFSTTARKRNQVDSGTR